MNFQVTENKLITDVSNIVGISRNNNTIKLKTDAPASSAIFLIIKGFNSDITLPLYINDTEEDGNVFITAIQFNKSQITFINDHPLTVYTCTFIINNETVEGEFKFTVASNNIAIKNSGDDIFIQLNKEVSKLKSDLYLLQKSYPEFNKSEVDLKKGMCPIATGVSNEYEWDYPLVNVYSKIKTLSTLCKDLADQNKTLTEKISALESKLNDHLYEENTL